MATSGIAANLLDGGQTAHSIFKIPIQIFDDSTCNINVTSDLAELIRKADIIIWDEAVMAHKHLFMAVHRTISDIVSADDPSLKNKWFGNKIVIFGGDFRHSES